MDYRQREDIGIFVQRIKEGVGPVGNQLWRYKHQLVCRPGATLPDRCVKCNAAANGGRLHRQLSWHRGALELGLCDAHRKRRVLIVVTSWLTVVGGLALAFFAFVNNYEGVCVLSVMAAMGATSMGFIFGPQVAVARMDQGYVRVIGVCREYLDTLPEWSGPT